MSVETALNPTRVRTRTAMWMCIGALISTGMALGSFWLQRATTGVQTLSGKVLPDFQADLPQVRTITLKSSAGTFNLVRSGTKWVMAERDNYPVKADALSLLAKQLTDLTYVAARTSDPAQFARMGVDDALSGRDGYQVTLKGGTGQVMQSLFVASKSDSVFMRKAGSNDVFEVRGDVSALGPPASWLDMAVLEVLPENIATVMGQPTSAERYDIVRRPDGGFAPVGGVANGAATATALALTKWNPLDVKAASLLATDQIASHVTTLRDGILISVAAYRENDGLWVVLSADGADGQATPATNAINQRTDGWAYQLDEASYGQFAPASVALILGAGAP